MVYFFFLRGSGKLLRHYFFGCVLGCVWLWVCVFWRVWKWVETFSFTCVHGVMLCCCGCGSECMLRVLGVSLVMLWGCFFCFFGLEDGLGFGVVGEQVNFC